MRKEPIYTLGEMASMLANALAAVQRDSNYRTLGNTTQSQVTVAMREFMDHAAIGWVTR